MPLLPAVICLLCAVASLACMALLIRTYLRNRRPILLWTAVCFVALAVNNALLFVDLIILPETDLLIPRHLTALAGTVALLYGFIWEADR